jgi:hypothetical protein
VTSWSSEKFRCFGGINSLHLQYWGDPSQETGWQTVSNKKPIRSRSNENIAFHIFLTSVNRPDGSDIFFYETSEISAFLKTQTTVLFITAAHKFYYKILINNFGSKHKNLAYAELLLLPASCRFLASFILKTWRWNQYFTPKHQVSFIFPYGFTTQWISNFTVAVVWTSHLIDTAVSPHVSDIKETLPAYTRDLIALAHHCTQLETLQPELSAKGPARCRSLHCDRQPTNTVELCNNPSFPHPTALHPLQSVTSVQHYTE